MKRVLSVVLTLSMLLTFVSTASAGTVAEGTSFVPNPMDLALTVSVGARESGSGNEYVYPPSPAVSVQVGFNEKKEIDYKAKLDMSDVRALFDEDFIQIVLLGDAQAKAEFDAGIVKTTINVLIEYPSAMIVDNNINLASRNVGVLDAGSIFSEKTREVNGNSLKIQYINKNNLTVRELQQNLNTYLKDITFTLENTLGYAEEGNHIVQVTLSGETLIDFASKDQRVIYSGTASNVVNVSKDNSVVNHRLEIIPVTAATCLTTGLTEGIVCRTHNSFDCGALGVKRQTVIPALNHQKVVEGSPSPVSYKVFIPTEESTCTKKGMAAHWTCSLCKSDFDSEESDTIVSHESLILPKAAHVEIDVPGSAATCTSVGFTAGKKCTVCGNITVVKNVIPALGHSEVILSASAPSCTETGLTQGVSCDRCHTVLTPQITIPATGHKFGAWSITTQPTESSTGLMERTCSVCSTVETQIIEKRQHTCVVDESLKVVIQEPTCTETGIAQNYCSCGKPVGASVVIPATGHTMTRVEGTTPTCVTEGVAAHYVCSVCDGIFRDIAGTNALSSTVIPVDRNNHGSDNIIVLKGIASTCIKQGLSDGTKCKNCNVIITKQELLPLVAHTPGMLATVPAKAATCEEHGVIEHMHCAICNKDFSMDGTTELTTRDFDVLALGHSYGEAVKEPENQAAIDGHFDGVKRCSRCDATIAVKIAVTPENCTHIITLDSITTEATCYSEGLKTQICLSCGLEVSREVIPMTPHTLVRTEVVQPTCHKTGTSAYYTCSVCDKMYSGIDASNEITEAPVLDKLEHVFREIGNGNNLQCIYCHEVVHVKKKDKNGNEDTSDTVKVNNQNVGVKKEEDVIKEESYLNVDEEVIIESEVLINERAEVSETLDNAIQASAPGESTDEEIVDKVVWDIEINKITTKTSSGDVDKEVIKELDDLIEIIIQIPAELVNSVDFLVHRLHVNELGQQETHVITTRPDPITGEYIIINKSAGTVTLKVKKFSEYVLVGYAKQVNNQTTTSGVGGGGRIITVQFKANGGTAVSNASVSYGDLVKEPVTTREGYVFAGWYKNAEFTEKFDFTKPVTSNLTLYAKWEEVDDSCDGTEADGCVSLKFNDVDTSLWYHLGIDFVVENSLMKGVSEDSFAPDANITRGMLVTILGRKEGVKDETIVSSPFADVAADQYYASHINWAVENEVVFGYGDDLFGPDDYITREQIAAIMHRYAKFKGYDVSAGDNTNILSYEDYSSISEYAIAPVQYAVGSGLMKGKSESTFNPQDYATRAEVATIMHRFLTSNN